MGKSLKDGEFDCREMANPGRFRPERSRKGDFEAFICGTLGAGSELPCCAASPTKVLIAFHLGESNGLKSSSGRKWIILVAALLASVCAIAPAIAISRDGAPAAPSAQPGHAPKKKLPAGGTSAAALPRTTKPEVVELMKKQEVPDKVVDRITGGQGEQNRDRIPGSSEVEVDPGVNRIALHWEGEPPGSVQGVLQDLPKGVSVHVCSSRPRLAKAGGTLVFQTAALGDGWDEIPDWMRYQGPWF